MTEDNSPKQYNIEKITTPEWQDWQADPQGLLCSFTHHTEPGSNGEYQKLSPQGSLQLDEAQVHIHLLRPDSTDARHYATLNVTEQRQAERFIFAKDRVLYTAAHRYVRGTLSRYADLTPQAWSFHKNAYGKPAITNPGYTSLCFNLSHTQGLIAIVVSHRTVGVDVEQARPLDDIVSLSRGVFATPELADVLARSGSAQQRRFFTYWTLKEAYIKARGMGLSIPLKQFYFTAGTEPTWDLQCDPSLNDSGHNWHCQAHCLADNYHLAFAVDKQIPTIPNNL